MKKNENIDRGSTTKKQAMALKRKYRIVSPMKAIRYKCLDCCQFQFNEVKMCSDERCPLYPYRFGRQPKEDDLNEEFKADGYNPRKK